MASYAGEHGGARGVRFSDVSWVLMTSAPLLTLTDAAREKILDARAGEPDGDSLALWFDVSGVEGNSFTYDMYFGHFDVTAAERLRALSSSHNQFARNASGGRIRRSLELRP
jgi:hypothetical protein